MPATHQALVVAEADKAERRALAFLAREVPVWAKENKCYSCHNNGDAARALYQAKRLGLPAPDEALADTSRWLSRPEAWHDNGGGKGPESDKKLARVQFAAALVEAMDASVVRDPGPLGRAAGLVAELQDADGSWRIDAPGTVGSPATHGSHLATHFAIRTLRRADATRYRKAVERAERWLSQGAQKSTPETAAVLLALGDHKGHEELCGRALDRLRAGQNKDGGWGPFPQTRAEPFDTAVALLALSRHLEKPGVKEMIRRGRDYLISSQAEDGSWPETTRPAGGESYAQRLSTAGWATQALLATRQQTRR